TFRIEYQPPITAAAINRKMAIRFCAESSMIRLIMFGSRGGVQLALGIDEKVAGRHDPLAGFESAEDLATAVELAPGLDVARLQKSVVAVDEDHLPQPGV